MRLMVYNIRYGTGGCRRPPWSGYLGRTAGNLHAIADFIGTHEPDVVGLLEVDAGSYRSGRANQAEMVASRLGHCHVYGSKYSRSHVARIMPLFNMQGNAFTVKDRAHRGRFHYFDDGMKRLVIELELKEVTIFLVHLAVGYVARHRQLSHLGELVTGTRRPCIVAGDFNPLRHGESELAQFARDAGMESASAGVSTFPSWEPSRQLDFVFRSAGVKSLGFSVPDVRLSDHLPLVYDFDVPV